MPTKRKRNAGPVVKRKLGSAKAVASTAAPSQATPAAATASSAEKTQPLAAVGAAGAPETAADGTADPSGGIVPGISISMDEGGTAQEAPERASEPIGTAKPKRRSVKRKAAKAKKGQAAAEDAPSEPASETTPDEEGTADKEDAAEKKDGKPKRPKPPSKRKQRREARKEAKAAKRAAMTPAQRMLRRLRTLLIVLVAAVVLVAATVVGALSYHRWYAYDDALDIQGTWYVSGTNTPIEVTADTIELTPEVAYHYTLDPSDKTIAFTFGRLSGQGHYRFSLDRQYLVIFDGEYSWEQSLSTDVSWLLRALADEATRTPNNLAQGAFYNVTLLSRSSAEGSDVSASVVATSEGPRVVWSAPDAEGGSEGESVSTGEATGSDGSGGEGGPNEGSPANGGASDVDSLLGAINDLPAE